MTMVQLMKAFFTFSQMEEVKKTQLLSTPRLFPQWSPQPCVKP